MSSSIVLERRSDVGQSSAPARAEPVSRTVVDEPLKDDISKAHTSGERESLKDGTGMRTTAGTAEGFGLRRYGHTFLSTEIASCRRAYFKIVLRATCLIIILTWSCLPIYWGSLSSSAMLTGNLEAWVIDRDQARIGMSLVSTVQSAPTKGPGSLGWKVVSADSAGDDDAVIQAVLTEKTWLAVVVSGNATLRLSAARARGNTSYDPSAAITMYYAQARNEVATANFLLPTAQGLLSSFCADYATGSAQRFLAAVVSADGSVNATALQLVNQAPQTLAPAVGYKMVNLRPYTAPVAQAVTLVGQIYLCIFAFIFVMAHASARTLVEPYLTFRSYLAVRLLAPLTIYVPLSLFYAMVSLPFKLPFGARYAYGAGFFAFFTYIYLGMCALGLALEAMVTILTTKFVPFFLVLLIIVNISTAALPPDLQHPLYSYAFGFPFWNIEQAIRTLVFNTNSHLAKNAGVLVAWSLISIATTTAFSWWVRRCDILAIGRSARSGYISPGKVPGSGPGAGARTPYGSQPHLAVNGNGEKDEKGKEKSSTVAVAADGWQKDELDLGGKEKDKEVWRNSVDVVAVGSEASGNGTSAQHGARATDDIV